MDSLAAGTCKKCSQDFPLKAQYWQTYKGKLTELCAECKKKNINEAFLCRFYDQRGKSRPDLTNVPSDHRFCHGCQASYPLTDKHFRLRKNGYYRCLACASRESKDYYAENTEKAKASVKAWAKANPERARANKKKTDSKPEIRLKRNAYHREWSAKNPETVKGYRTNYAAKYPEKVNAKNHKWRSRRLNAEGTHTASDVTKQLEAQTGRCWWCGVKLDTFGKNKFHVDHREPLSKGGSNGPENIVCACPKCNRQKSSKSALEFAGRLF